MANANLPQGLRPIQQNGDPWTGQGRMVFFPSTVLQNIFLGDPIAPLGGSDANGVPSFGLATAGAGNVVAGGLISVCNGPAGSGVTITRDLPVYHQAAVAGYGIVVDDPNCLYVIQEDSVGGAIAQAVGAFANGNLVAGAGNTITGFSGWMLQSSSVSATPNPTFQVRLLGTARGPDNALGNFADWVVRLNTPALWATGGV